MKWFKTIGKILLSVLGIFLLYIIYAFRFAPQLQKISGSDGKVKFGYDKLQEKWLFDEYAQHPLSSDGPYIFHDTKELMYVRNMGTGFAIAKHSYSSLPASLICYTDDTTYPNFTVKMKEEHKLSPCVYPAPKNLLAVSDIEGNFAAFVRLLVGNKVIDPSLSWNYGDGHLVLVGDFVDRGSDVMQCLWLIYKLEQEAEKAGGKVHYILGNHEQLNLNGRADYAAGKYIELLRQLNIPYKKLYAPNTETGKWLRSKNTIEKIGKVIFVHGGISPEVANANLSLEEINTLCRDNMDRPADSVSDANVRLLFGRKGILWYRGMVTDYKEYEKLQQQDVDAINTKMNCDVVVIGHSIVEEVSKDYGGKVIRIDIKHNKKEPSALLIQNGQYFKTNTKGILQKL